jgi:hypothetical protein
MCFPAANLYKIHSDPEKRILSNFQEPRTSISQYDMSIPRVDDSNVTIDGSISTNEYGGSFTEVVTNIDVYWEHDSVNLKVALVSANTGWLSLGIGDKMEGSNMILGGVDGTPYCVDYVGTTGWEHSEDSANGGSDDIVEFDASEDATTTILEFIIPLDPSDTLDPDMAEGGTYDMFLGYHATSDGLQDYHTGHSSIFSVFLRPGLVTRATSIVLQAPTTVMYDTTFNVSATLKDANDANLPNKTVVFYRESNFGNVEIGAVNTSNNGVAILTVDSEDLLGSHVFGARFYELIVLNNSELVAYTSSSDTEVVLFEAEEELPVNPVLIVLFYAVQGLFWVALGGIWLFYAYNVIIIVANFVEKDPRNKEKKEPWNDEL